VPTKPPAKPDAPEIPTGLERAPNGRALERLELECSLLEGADFSGQKASGVRIDQCRLARVDLGGAELTAATFQDVSIGGGTWANTRTKELRLRRASFKDVRMTGADFASASVEDVAFIDCRLDLASFVSARLTRVRFERCRMEELDLSGTKLSSVAFRDCSLTGSVWADATLTNCEMRGTDISGAVHIERLRGMRMPMADVLASAAEMAGVIGIEIVD
jgi:uncharacterized protein YjbI with pentapeptide repeats